MPRIHIFSDEAGDFVFANNGRASRYFIVCTVSLNNCSIGNELLTLRRDMIWRDLAVNGYFHATEDKNDVRQEVYDLIRRHDVRVDATLLEKAKAQPQVRRTQEACYKYAWFYHFKHVGPKIVEGHSEASITAASIGTKKGQAVFTNAVNDVVQQVKLACNWKTFFPTSAADPCLQIADYCAWAIQRKWERNDFRWYDFIQDKICTEYDLWERGKKRYY